MPRILLVDDEQPLCAVLRLSLERIGFECDVAHSVVAAKTFLTSTSYEAILTDLNLNTQENGLDLVQHVVKNYPSTPIALMSAYGDANIAIDALRLGAFDYIDKPIRQEALRMLIEKATQASQEINLFKQLDVEQGTPLDVLVGVSPCIMKLKSHIKKLSRGQAPIFIHGESGSGKEVVANILHTISPRKNGPFVAINCGAIPAELLENELFGSKKGAFTGSTQDKIGLIQSADGGTLFLDEIAELPRAMQVKLLRVLQEKKIRPVGSEKEIYVDFRVISATHQDLEQCIRDGTFREDLYFRLHVLDVYVPPLRERGGDILLLADFFVASICQKWDMPIKKISLDVRDWLLQQHFSGNVRELGNIIERALSLSECDEIALDDIVIKNSPKPSSHLITDEARDSADQLAVQIPREGLEAYLAASEKRIVEAALQQCGGNVTQSAQVLGVSLRSMRYRIQKHCLAVTEDE